MQQKNGFPNLYANEKMIPTMMGQQSWNRLETVENVQNFLKVKPFSTFQAPKLKVTWDQTKSSFEKI